MDNKIFLKVAVKGQEIALEESEFWHLWRQLFLVAERENVKGAVNCYVDDYDMTEEQVEEMVEEICDGLEDVTGNDWDEVVLNRMFDYIKDNDIQEAS